MTWNIHGRLEHGPGSPLGSMVLACDWAGLDIENLHKARPGLRLDRPAYFYGRA